VAKPEERSDESYRLCYMLKVRALFFSSFKRNTDVELDLSKVEFSHRCKRSAAMIC